MRDSAPNHNARRIAIGSAVAFAAILAVLAIFLGSFAPKRAVKRMPPFQGYDKRAMAQAMSVESVKKEMEAILAFGSRRLGQEGYSKAQAHIRKEFEAAGLKVLEYPQKVAVPTTIRREALGADGKALPDVEIFPFLPNHFQPIVTPPGGITGRLLKVDSDLMLSGVAFDDCIAVVDVSNPPKYLGVNWVAYAEKGFKAVVLTHTNGLAGVSDSDAVARRSHISTPVNYTRVAATEGILRHLNETVTLNVVVKWEEVEDTALVGILPSDHRADEALVVTACADACSFLPDSAPGTLGAVNVAAQMALLKGITAYKDAGFKRDIVFVSYGSQMMALLTPDRLAAILGTAAKKEVGRVELRKQREQNDAESGRVREAFQCFRDEGFMADRDGTSRALAALSPGARAVVDEQTRYVLNSALAAISEEVLQARLAFLRTGEKDLSSPEFAAYRKAKHRYDEVMAVAGYPLAKLVAENRDLLDRYSVRRLCFERFRELAAFHEWKARQLAQAFAIHDALGRYERIIPFGSYLMPAEPDRTKGEAIAYYGSAYGQDPVIHDLVQSVMATMDLPANVKCAPFRATRYGESVKSAIDALPVDVEMWSAKGHPGFVLLNTDRSYAYASFGSAVEKPYMRNLDSMASSLQVFGRCALALAFGDGKFEAPRKVQTLRYSGRVFMANVGRSIVPSHPLAHALLSHKRKVGEFQQPGYYTLPFFFADVYGRYHLPLSSVRLTQGFREGYGPEAAAFDANGLVTLVKDEGPQGQNIYKSVNLSLWDDRQEVNVVVFRAAPVTLLDLINPQSLKAYTDTGFITRDGLAPMPKFNVFKDTDGMVTAFLEPDRRFFVTLKAGAQDNLLVQTIRAFALGVDDKFAPSRDREIDGKGFLPADTPFLPDLPREVANSMLLVNGRRLELQLKYDMADEWTRTFHERSGKLLQASRESGKSRQAALLEKRDSVTYTTLNHPVLRRSVFEAVVGILWYLGLLVPFVFFFEKLAFGFADIRKQLAAQAVIFLVVFALLRMLHPAFEMIRSSAMILLGFVIMLVSGGVTVLFAGKFQENLEELRKKRGQVAAAEINTLGVMATAFALGLNNMHRRIVRTGLTCVTLVLITFAMICFTSIQSNLSPPPRVIGKAPYQGLLLKRGKMAPISGAELSALQTKYGHRFTVARRTMTVGVRSWDRMQYNPMIELAYEPENEPPRKIAAAAILGFDPGEPLRHRIRLLAGKGWFTPELIKAAGDIPPVIIPDTLAASLRIPAAAVDRTNVTATLNDRLVTIHGIYSAESLGELRDIDGVNMLPFDVEAMRTFEVMGGSVLASDSDPRLSADKIIFAPVDSVPPAANAENRMTSVAVVMPDLSYKEAKAQADQYMEQSGQVVYYGLDQDAYRGKRTRERTLSGMLEILIPLIIAAMTVLNTMRGSVYERKDEIFVYNAVGIAPRYIFAMFFSEAFVYAVVGSVLGYILSQGVGRVLLEFGWTGGLNMTFTSLNTIYASLAIMAAVFISTFFPARQAMRIAMPAEDIGWKLPEPDGDSLSLSLPFTFDSRGRIAVLAFFARYFGDHGEGSSGRFFAAPPLVRLSSDTDPLADGAYIPELDVTIWLKPFDLGVSQRLTITMPTDPETREYVARITLTRVSGTREAWIRLNKPFVTLLRRHFLYWRAVGQAERNEMFEEARGLLEREILRQEKANVEG